MKAALFVTFATIVSGPASYASSLIVEQAPAMSSEVSVSAIYFADATIAPAQPPRADDVHDANAGVVRVRQGDNGYSGNGDAW